MLSSKQPLLPLHIPKRPDIGQSKSKSVLVLIADRAQRKPTIFYGDAAAVPIVGALGSPVLECLKFKVVSDVSRGAPAFLAWTAVAHQGAYLVINLGNAGGRV